MFKWSAVHPQNTGPQAIACLACPIATPLIRITLSPQIQAKAAGTEVGLCEWVSLSQRRLKQMCADLWTWHWQASLSTQPNPQAWDSISFRFSWQNAHVLSASLYFMSFFFSFFRSQGLCFTTFHLRVTPAAHARCWRIIHAAMWRALIWGTLRCRGTEIRDPCEAGGNVSRWFEAFMLRLGSQHELEPHGVTGSNLAVRPIMRCNGPSSCVINRWNNTDTVSECTANSWRTITQDLRQTGRNYKSIYWALRIMRKLWRWRVFLSLWRSRLMSLNEDKAHMFS